MSKVSKLIRDFLDDKGCSSLIDRYNLPEGLSYTSGDGIFRSDSSLAKKGYKFFRFSPTLDLNKKSFCWKLIEEDKETLRDIHKKIDFKGKKGNTVYYIQFFGKTELMVDEGIRKDIIDAIRKQPCAHCKTKINIECDHKNDLKNDLRVMYKYTQIIDDFQPLCKHCNDIKRSVKKKMLISDKRIGATYLDYKIDFTKGTEYLDKEDPNWYIGTYWGDCKAFKQWM
jgi:hypothetical protein